MALSVEVEKEEYMEDVLLALLIFNVDNKGEWMGKDVVQLKVSPIDDKNFEKIIRQLKKKKYIEVVEEEDMSRIRITKNGIEYIMERI